MKVSDAKVCVECDEVVSMGAMSCPSCTSTTFWFFSRRVVPILTRQQLDEARRVRRERELVGA